MARYTDAQTFGPYTQRSHTAHVAIQANGGNVSISTIMSDGAEIPVEGSPFTEDQAFKVDVTSGTFLVTPTGGAAYEWSS